MTNQLKTAEELARTLYRYVVSEQPLASLSNLNEEQVQRFRQQGYLAIENVLTLEEVRSAAKALEDIIAGTVTGARLQYEFSMNQQYKDRPSAGQVSSEDEIRTPEERVRELRNIYEYTQADERLKAIACKPKLLDVFRTLMGEEPIMVQDMALLKPPFGGSEKPWHQDMAYGALNHDKPIIAAWIAIDEATIDNGCMHVIPGSHGYGATPHYAIRDWQLCDSMVPVERDVTIPLKPGSVLFFHGMLYHGTPANLSPLRRWALQLHYKPATASPIDPIDHKRVYTNAMTGVEC